MLFCQEQASSKEDIWPQWLTKRFSVGSRMEAERGGRKLGTWQINTPQPLLSKCVCRSCNNGWMSRLEQEMKPIVDSILDGRLEILDVSSQAVIAVWAIKTAMVLETLYPEREFFYMVSTNISAHSDRLLAICGNPRFRPQELDAIVQKGYVTCPNHRNCGFVLWRHRPLDTITGAVQTGWMACKG